MSQQHQKWIQIVKDKLNSEGMTQTHFARACGVKKPTISELLKYGKGSDRLKNRVCDVLGIDESWVDLGEQEMNNTAQKVTRIDKTDLGFEHWVDVTYQVPILENKYTVKLLLLMECKVEDQEVIDYLVSTWKYRDLVLHSVRMYEMERDEGQKMKTFVFLW